MAPPPTSGDPHPLEAARARFQQFVLDREIRRDTADDLYNVLTTSKVVLVLDDRYINWLCVCVQGVGRVGGCTVCVSA